MNETTHATTISRVNMASAELAATAWTSLAYEGIAPFAGEDAREGILFRLGDPGRVLLCAHDGSTPIGLSMFERMPDKRIRLEALAVLPNYRRRGTGAALLTQGLFAALPATAMYFLVRESDRAAIAWARDRSFRPGPAAGEVLASGLIEFELRLDAPANGCGSASGCACGGEGCASPRE